VRISLDTETTGLDLRHGARPFLVTTAFEEDSQVYTDYWGQWPVDPYTRKVRARCSDLVKIQRWMDDATEYVFQNPKFDLTALSLLFADYGMTFRWDWSKVRDTLLAGHLLKSNQPHDLTTMTLVYLGINVQPYEDEIKRCTVECRRMAQGRNPQYNWRIAKEDSPKDPRPEMPSAKGETWKNDMWLPSYVAKVMDYHQDHEYRIACVDYSVSDSDSTYRLYGHMEQLLKERGLWCIYQERLKLLPVVYQMEQYGVTVNKARLRKLRDEYLAESGKAGSTCLRIAKDYDYNLQLPKSGRNGSLTKFVFGSQYLGLEPYETSDKTGDPSLNKRCKEHYEVALDEGSPAYEFITNLGAKTKRDTALGYMASYERYWLPMSFPDGVEFNVLEMANGKPGIHTRIRQSDTWFRLHPSLNATGTDTLRWSSSNPNEQNISKKEGFNLRYGFGPAPGREWWSGDAKNIELRIPAYESEQQELIELFEHPDTPPYYGSTHLLNFHTVYPDIWDAALKKVGLEKVGPYCKNIYASSWYQYCKNGGFAVQYGAIEIEGKEGTADKAFHRLGSHAKLKARFDKLEALNNGWIAVANDCGYVETLPDKTVDPDRGYPIWCSRSRHGHVKPTIPLNYHVQSTAMWWMMKAMIRVQAYLDDLNAVEPKYFMVCQVHDELVFDFPYRPNKGNMPKIRKLRRLMEQGGDDIGLPTPVAFTYHPETWATGESIL